MSTRQPGKIQTLPESSNDCSFLVFWHYQPITDDAATHELVTNRFELTQHTSMQWLASACMGFYTSLPAVDALIGMLDSVSPYLLQSLGPFDTKSQQLFRFQFRSYPIFWGLQVPVAFLAPENADLLLYRGCDIDLRSYAVDAHIGRVAHNGGTT